MTLEKQINLYTKIKKAATTAVGGLILAASLTLGSPAEAKPLGYLQNLAQRVKDNPDFRTADTYTREFWISRGNRMFVTYRDNGDGKIGDGDRLSIVQVVRKGRRNQSSMVLDDLNLDGFSSGTGGDYANGLPPELVSQFKDKVKNDGVLYDMHQISVAKKLISKCKYVDRKRKKRVK